MFGSLCSCVSSSVLTKPSRVAQVPAIRLAPIVIGASHRPAPLRLVSGLTRYPELDIARGVFLALMISSHAIGLANVPADGFLRSSFWLPRGWSTVGFQVLAGFTIGLMFTAADRSRQRRMWVRAARLAAVMVGSNIILLACKYALWGQFWRFKDPAWWIGAATFTADSSISIFLAPTVVLLAATPWLLALERQVSNELFAAFAVTLFVGGWALFGATTSSSYQLSAGWVVLPLAGNGFVGLVLGSWWSRNEAARRSVRPRAASVAFVCLAAIVASLSPAPLVQMTVGTVLRFAAIVTLAMTVTARSGQPVVRAISKLGRHSIAVFILHRPVIQAFQFAIARVELPASARYVFLYPATIACMVMMCMLRDRHQAVDRMLRAIHL